MQKFSRKLKHSKGFTLVELLVVIVIIIILATLVILIVNPQKQLAKARDGQRKNDLQAISSSLARYILDHGKYPLSTDTYQIQGVPWGSSWQPYMAPLPKDPLATQSYAYYSDGNTYQLYAKLEQPDANGCGTCGPGGIDNWSVTSNNSAPVVLAPAPTPVPTATPTPGPTATPAPTPVPGPSQRVAGNIQVFISTQHQPQMMQLTINPFDPTLGASQTLTITARDTSGSPITQLTAQLNTDTTSNTYTLNLTGGTSTNGTWSATYNVADSHETVYNMTLTATDQSGAVSQTDVQLDGSLTYMRSQLH